MTWSGRQKKGFASCASTSYEWRLYDHGAGSWLRTISYTSSKYEYDFGDGWVHEVLLEGILLKTKCVKYPTCLAGERACPTERPRRRESRTH